MSRLCQSSGQPASTTSSLDPSHHRNRHLHDAAAARAPKNREVDLILAGKHGKRCLGLEQKKGVSRSRAQLPLLTAAVARSPAASRKPRGACHRPERKGRDTQSTGREMAAGGNRGKASRYCELMQPQWLIRGLGKDLSMSETREGLCGQTGQEVSCTS